MLFLAIFAGFALFWVIFCFIQFINRYATYKGRMKHIRLKENNQKPYPWLKDFVASVILIGIGMLLVGVTGMLIGLFASLMFSAYSAVDYFLLGGKNKSKKENIETRIR